MAGTFARSKQLIAESFEVLKKDKELVRFPIFSGFASALVTLSFAFPFLAVGNGSHTAQYAIVFLYYLASYFVVTFFAAGLTAAAYKRLMGGDPTVSDGWQAATQHIGGIFVWSLISATVGIVLRMIDEQNKTLSQVAAAILGTAWNILTLFVVPLIVLDDINAFAALKESGPLFKKTWGENFVVSAGMGLIFFLLSLLGFVPLILAVLSHQTILMIVASLLVVIYWIVLSIVSSSLNSIFLTALYVYAKTGKVPEGFSGDLIQHAYVAKH